MDFLQKGRKGSGAPIGSLKMFGGREYIKTSSGWKYHGKGGGKKATEHRELSRQVDIFEENPPNQQTSQPLTPTVNTPPNKVFESALATSPKNAKIDDLNLFSHKSLSGNQGSPRGNIVGTYTYQEYKDILDKVGSFYKKNGGVKKALLSAPQKIIQYEDLIPLQQTVSPQKVQDKLIGKDNNQTLPVVFKINGKMILEGGTHRTSADILRGNSSGTFAFIDLDKPFELKQNKHDGPTADDMLKHPNTKRTLEDLGWGERFLAKTKNYKPDTYYRVEGTGLGYTGAGQGMYVGRDKDALKRFYDMEGEGFEVVEFKGQPKWLNLMDPDEHSKFEQEAKQKYGEDDPSVANHMKKLAQERGYEGIRYYDPYATGEEFVLFDTKKLKSTSQQPTAQKNTKNNVSTPVNLTPYQPKGKDNKKWDITSDSIFPNKFIQNKETRFITDEGQFGDLHKAPILNLSINDLHPTQIGLDKKQVIHYKNGGYDKNVTAHKSELYRELPTAVRYKGKIYIVDGHHRIAGSILDGDKNIRIHVRDYEEYVK